MDRAIPFSRAISLTTVFTALLLTAACQTTDGAGASSDWQCDAPGLANGSYTGGSTAYIHLSAYSSGHNYSVTREGDRRVSGTTSDGTKFTCTKVK